MLRINLSGIWRSTKVIKGPKIKKADKDKIYAVWFKKGVCEDSWYFKAGPLALEVAAPKTRSGVIRYRIPIAVKTITELRSEGFDLLPIYREENESRNQS